MSSVARQQGGGGLGATGMASKCSKERETVLAFREGATPPRKLRSTIVIASIDGLRRAQLFAEYQRHLAGSARVLLLESVAGEWMPIEVGMAHYKACDCLGLGAAAQFELGRDASARIGESFVGTASRLARQVGATPFAFFGQLHRFWDRAYDGGGLGLFRLGPKDAEFELVDFPLCASAFYRNALRGWAFGLASLFCSRLFVRELAQPRGPHSMALRAQWV